MSDRARIFALLLCLGLVTSQSACEALQQEERARSAARIDEAIALHKTAAEQIKLGDSKDKVLNLLEPTQAGLLSNEIKAPVAFPTEREDGRPSMVEVFYFRSHRFPDLSVPVRPDVRESKQNRFERGRSRYLFP